MPGLCPFSFSSAGLHGRCRGAISDSTLGARSSFSRSQGYCQLVAESFLWHCPGQKGLAHPKFSPLRGQLRPMTCRCTLEKSRPALESPWGGLMLCYTAGSSTSLSAQSSIFQSPWELIWDSSPVISCTPIFGAESQGIGPKTIGSRSGLRDSLPGELWSRIPAGQRGTKMLSLVVNARLRCGLPSWEDSSAVVTTLSCWRNWDRILVEGNARQVAYFRRVRGLRKLVIIKTMGLNDSC